MDDSTCSFDGCDKQKSSKGLCGGHYTQLRKGNQLKPLGKRSISHSMSYAERFHFYISKTDTCWNWTGPVHSTGYGEMYMHGKEHRAHRLSYITHYGPIPDGLFIDHKCHNRLCVNPEHLRIADAKLNAENLTGGQSGKTSAHRGVSWSKSSKKWRALVGHQGKLIHVGYFMLESEAAEAAKSKRLELFQYGDGR